MEVQQWQVNCTNSVPPLYVCSFIVMGGACGMCGGKQIHAGFWWSDVKERNDLEYLRIDGMMLINNDWE